MNKKLIFAIIGIIILILLTGCKKEVVVLFKDIPGAEIPNDCVRSKDDVCALFACMSLQMDVSCWCDEYTVKGGILKEGSITVSNEEQAMQVVRDYDENIKVERAVKLDNIFYNVFCDVEGNEEVYTVAVDGTIMRTVCGV